MALTPLQRSALYTLAYTAQFDYPLTAEEVWFRIIGKLDSRKRLLTSAPKLPEIKRALEALRAKKLVQKEGPSYEITGTEDLVETRRRRFRIAQGKWREARKAVTLFKHVPWIQAVFITGSLAMDNARIDEDIDFMIVTSPRRLWLTRLLVSAIAWIHGKRRSWQGEEKRSWCFNLWLEETHLDLFTKHASVYTAYELIQARLVFDRSKVGERLMAANRWIEGYLPMATRLRGKQLFAKAKKTHFWVAYTTANTPLSKLSDRLNARAYSFQRWYMKPHKTREKVSKHYALFHPRNTQGWLYGRWQRVLQQLVS